jgi:hypothetical protein
MTVKVVPRVMQLFFTMNAAARRGEQINPNVVIKTTCDTPPPAPKIRKRRCSRAPHGCKEWVEVTYELSKCPICLRKKNDWTANNAEHIAEVSAEYRANNAEKIKKSMDAWNKSESAKVCKATYKLTPKGIEAEERYRRSAARRASQLRERQNGKKLVSNARYRANHRAELKVKQDAWNHSPMGLLTRALCKMVKGEHWDPQSFPKLGSFACNEEARVHLEERFDPWMSWENQGRHIKGNEYNVAWNIGHALPRKIFNQWEQEDLRRCWHPDNLFPQCARQNTELRDALIYTDAELLEMRHLWPVGANDDLAQLKGLFQFVDHDFINSKLEAEAGPSGLNDGFVSDDASSTSG